MKSEAGEERLAVHLKTIQQQRDALFYGLAGKDRK